VIHTQKKDLVFFNTGLNTDLKKVEHTQKKASKLGRPPNLSLALEQEQVHQVKPKLGRPPRVSLALANTSQIKHLLKLESKSKNKLFRKFFFIPKINKQVFWFD